MFAISCPNRSPGHKVDLFSSWISMCILEIQTLLSVINQDNAQLLSGQLFSRNRWNIGLRFWLNPPDSDGHKLGERESVPGGGGEDGRQDEGEQTRGRRQDGYDARTRRRRRGGQRRWWHRRLRRLLVRQLGEEKLGRDRARNINDSKRFFLMYFGYCCERKNLHKKIFFLIHLSNNIFGNFAWILQFMKCMSWSGTLILFQDQIFHVHLTKKLKEDRIKISVWKAGISQFGDSISPVCAIKSMQLKSK